MTVKKFSMKVFKWISFIFGGLLVAFFLIMFIGESITSNNWVKLAPKETLMFIALGIAFAGLILAYFKQLAGGILTIAGSLAFITIEFIGGQRIMSLQDGFFFYLLLLAGVIHVVVWSIRRRKEAG